nr:P-loop NTPase fold protein [Pseudomonas sp. ICBG1301]
MVIIFDDLERSNVDPKELLGYINHIVEISKIHTILVAHEKFLLENDDKKIYRDFKEKIIDKTFEIRQDHEKVISSFLEETKNKIIIGQKNLIQQIYESSKHKNLRSLKQSIFDFKYLLSEIDDEYLENQKFLEILALTFFALSIEVKKGSISEEDIRKGIPFSSNTDPSDIYKKYFRNQKLSIYTSDIWADIIFKGHSSEVNRATSKLAFFFKENKKEAPYWVKLCTYEELEFEEFSKLLPILKNDIQSNTTDSATIYLHKISLAIYFSKHDLLELDMEKFRLSIKEATKNESLLQHWKDQPSNYDFGSSGAGYLYLSHNDKEFNEIKKEISDKAKAIHEKNQKEEYRKSLSALSENLINCIKNGNLEYFSSILTKIHETNPILQNISPVIFAKTLAEAKNITIAEISRIMGQRYTENKSLNSRVNHYYLAPEIKFWKSAQKHIKKTTETTDKLKCHILNKFNECTIKEIIIKLSRHT